jgi:hypothetical protein
MTGDEQIESVAKLYTKATENDWRTVQPAAKQATGEQASPAAEKAEEAPVKSNESEMTTAETIKLMNVARSILVNENGTVG